MTRTASQKARARAAATAKTRKQPVQRSTKAKGARWHLGFNNFAMGSGDAPKPHKAKGRDLDLVGTGPWEINSDVGRRSVAPIYHDELLGTIDSSTSFASTPQVLQPGLVNILPWMSRVAQLYQKYRIRSFEYYYKPFVSQFDALGQRGRIVLCFDYDALAQNLTTLTQAEALTPNVVGMGYESLVLRLDPTRATSKDGKFIRTGPAAVGSDLKSYDAGVLYVVTSGFGSVAQLGELHARYELELLNPMLPDALAPQINYTAAVASDAGPVNMASGVGQNTNFVFSTSSASRIANGLGITFVGGGASGTQMILPAGMFLITFSTTIAFTSTSSAALVALQINAASVLGGTSSTISAGAIGTQHLHGSYLLNAVAGDILVLVSQATFAGNATAQGRISIVNV